MLPEILARELLLHPSYIPLIDTSRKQSKDGSFLRVRPAKRTRALLRNGDESAVAAESQSNSSAWQWIPRSGQLIISAYADANRGFKPLLDSGTFAGPVLASSADGYITQPTIAPHDDEAEQVEDLQALRRRLAKGGLSLNVFVEGSPHGPGSVRCFDRQPLQLNLEWGPASLDLSRLSMLPEWVKAPAHLYPQ